MGDYADVERSRGGEPVKVPDAQKRLVDVLLEENPNAFEIDQRFSVDGRSGFVSKPWLSARETASVRLPTPRRLNICFQ